MSCPDVNGEQTFPWPAIRKNTSVLYQRPKCTTSRKAWLCKASVPKRKKGLVLWQLLCSGLKQIWEIFQTSLVLSRNRKDNHYRLNTCVERKSKITCDISVSKISLWQCDSRTHKMRAKWTFPDLPSIKILPYYTRGPNAHLLVNHGFVNLPRLRITNG